MAGNWFGTSKTLDQFKKRLEQDCGFEIDRAAFVHAVKNSDLLCYYSTRNRRVLFATYDYFEAREHFWRALANRLAVQSAEGEVPMVLVRAAC